MVEWHKIKHSAAPQYPISLHFQQDMQQGPYVLRNKLKFIGSAIGLIERNCLSVCFPLGLGLGVLRWGDDLGLELVALRLSPQPGFPLMV